MFDSRALLRKKPISECVGQVSNMLMCFLISVAVYSDYNVLVGCGRRGPHVSRRRSIGQQSCVRKTHACWNFVLEYYVLET